ncbi:MAG: hypothetical protein K2N80_13640 [Lachnospiraceae bacterium]|nr:hypothetical protein [Lachnospiraceae bacterium]
MVTYDSDENMKYQSRYEYDEQGNMVQQSIYNADGEIEYQKKLEFDAQGNQIGEENYKKVYDRLVKTSSLKVILEYKWITIE